MPAGGKRKGAGRKPKILSEIKTTENNQVSATDNLVNNAGSYTPKIDPVKELEKLYKLVDKCNDKAELNKLTIKIDLLNKMLPYVSYKKPTAETKKEDNPTTVEIKGIDLEKL